MSLFFSIIFFFIYFNFNSKQGEANRVDPRASDRQLGGEGSLGQGMT